MLVRSTARDGRREKAREGKLGEEANRLAPAVEALARQRPASEAEAQAAPEWFSAKQTPALHTVTAEV